jgi:hypothetical protein
VPHVAQPHYNRGMANRGVRTPHDTRAQALTWLAEMLKSYGHPDVDPACALFVMERDVRWERGTYRVPRSTLFDADATEPFAELCVGGPSWVHFNLVLPPMGSPLITLDAGARVANPAPSVNILYEERDVIIVDP